MGSSRSCRVLHLLHALVHNLASRHAFSQARIFTRLTYAQSVPCLLAYCEGLSKGHRPCRNARLESVVGLFRGRAVPDGSVTRHLRTCARVGCRERERRFAFDHKQIIFWVEKYGEETLLKDCMQTLGLRICELVNFDTMCRDLYIQLGFLGVVDDQ